MLVRIKSTNYFSHVRQDLLALLPPGTTLLLDVGCGTGATSAEAKRLGVTETFGIEIAPPAAAVAATVLDKVAIGDIESIQIDWGLFDCILCGDVLEHLKDPWETLRKLRNHLSNDGVLIASIPNIAHLRVISKIVLDRFEYEDEGILDKTHLRFFTKHTIKQLFETTGYHIATMKPLRTKSIKYQLATLATFGLLSHCSITQYIVVARHRVSDG